MIELEPEEFNALINDLGQDVLWRKANECPCRDPRSGASDPECGVCQNGIIWDKAVCARLGLTGQKTQRAWAQFGRYENGDVVVTLGSDSPAYRMGEFDRVTFVDSSVAFSHHLRNDGTPQRLRFPVEKIERVFWLNPDKTAVIEGRIPVVKDTLMTWTTGGPPVGVTYTVTGRQNPEYFVFSELVQDRAHHGGKTLPRRVVLRNFDLFRRGA